MSEFSSQYAKFKSNESSLPESIRIRLNYIASKILKQRINLSEFSEEVRMEIKELEFLDDKTLQIIFSLIFHTLALDNIEVAKKCLAKRKGLFRFWGDSTIEY